MDLYLITVAVLVISFIWAVLADPSDIGHIESFLAQKNHLLRKRYRPIYHITAPEGWISNPTGFTFYKRQYHVFYQYHPYNGAWGHVSWGHAVSNNLIDWVHYPNALMPREYYDRHGCLAGSAVVNQSFLMLFYTGNVVSKNETFQTQNVAVSGDGVLFQKYLYNPIIRQSPNGVGEFRNPKIWHFRKLWYMILGTTSRERYGQLLLYTSEDLFNWKLNSTLVRSYGDMGYVWENPDLFELDGYHVLIISAQGIEVDGWRFRNLYQTGYIIGHFNHYKGKFDDIEVSVATFNQLDYGHDFYAAKTMTTSDGRRILIAWLGMWDSEFKESSSGWASMLTIVRELRLNKNGMLLMTPIKETEELRVELLENAWYSPGEIFPAESKSFELIVNSTSIFSDVGLVFEWKLGMFTISYSAELQYISIDRGGIDGIRRAYWSPVSHVSMRIFLDSSSIEVFCGDGEVVFSSRIYPKSMRVRVAGNSQLYILQYRLRRSVGFDNDFVQRLKNFVMHT
ncbi:unnamed protein product, partial [Brenthis ino]